MRDNEKMDEDFENLFERKEVRKKKDKKRSHKQTSEKEEFAKESFKRMREEIEELRKRENDRTKELDELKKKIEDQQNQPSDMSKKEYALDFDADAYLAKGFIESAKWIKDVIAKNMTEKMLIGRNKARFEAFVVARHVSKYLGVRTCAHYNRGEPCNQGKWHSTHVNTRPEALWTRHNARNQDEGASTSQQTNRSDPRNDLRNDLRLHSCTLCLEALGAAFGHGMLDCPWILKKNWME